MANREHLAKLKEGREAWNVWRWRNNVYIPDLRDASLGGADLREMPLGGVDFSGANLKDTILIGANLVAARLYDADLTNARIDDVNLSFAACDGANFSGTNLDRTNLTATRLIDVDLTGTHLYSTLFGETVLSGANISGSEMVQASFCAVDISQVKGLSDVELKVNSTIGTDTLSLTLRSSGGRFTDEELVFFLMLVCRMYCWITCRECWKRTQSSSTPVSLATVP